MPDTLNPLKDLGNGPVLLYDGECGFCSKWVRWVLNRDSHGVFKYGALQGRTGKALLAAAGLDSHGLKSVVVFHKGKQHLKSDGALIAFQLLGQPWSFIATMCRIFPVSLRDAVYDFIGRHRMRLSKEGTACALPKPEELQRFLD